MNDDSVVSMAQLKELIKLGDSATFIRNNQEGAYAWINTTLVKFKYFHAFSRVPLENYENYEY